MVMRLPENLAPENYPLGWLVDSWYGGGVMEYDNVPASAYIHELRIDNNDGGPYLRFNSTIWLAKESPEVVDKEASGQETYNRLTKDIQWSTSSGYLRVNPNVTKREDGASEVEAMLASPAGTSQVWFGLVNGPRLQLITDAIARSESGAELNGAKIIAGNVSSDLFYAYDMEAFGFEMRNYLAGKLSRQFDDSVDAQTGPAGAQSEEN
ncbi:FABP family protein [Arcanobacterium ihumii]|uniref:FABP family protein n=1 Tax=Arcanobacterium ihumii TaxID=2138162 RepID=UPI000F531BA6|nr:FABP family protein [Arcanobacterium ihumii]